MKTKHIAIIGGGPAGLVAAKEMQALGLSPTVFEKRPALGGVWEERGGFTWPGMRTNISRYSCVFSDFDWAARSPLFPVAQEVASYLKDYAAAFDLNKNMRFETEVTAATPHSQGWLVESRTQGQRVGAHYDGLVVASGVFSQPHVPSMPGLEAGRDFWTHAAGYRGGRQYRDRHVVVAGGSYTGFEIAADLAASGARVTHIVSSPPWVIPRLLPMESGVLRPLDLAFYTRAGRKAFAGLTPAEANRKRNRFMASIATQFWGAAQGLCAPALTRDADAVTPPFVVISDDYPAQVKAGNIMPLRGVVVCVAGRKTVMLGGGAKLSADALIFCTGYKPDLSYMPRDVLARNQYRADDPFLALPLDTATLPAAMPHTAFVGFYRGPFFPIMELQARYAAALFAGKKGWPSQQALVQGVEESAALRRQTPLPQFPYGDYVGLADRLAQRIDAIPVAAEGSRWAKLFAEGPLLPAQYRLNEAKTGGAARATLHAHLSHFRAQGWFAP